MRILLLCHSFNSLSQRLFTALTALGHQLSVELDISDSVTEEACALFQPELLIAPFLKRRIPEAVWRSVVCLVVHPGPPGDRGPSALDWAVLEQAPQWGVTVLQANADFDAGPVWAHASFDMRSASKGSLYRSEVTQAAVAAVLHAVERFGARGGPLVPSKAVDAASQASLCNNWRPSMPQAARRIDWVRHDTSEILARLRSADGQPGVQDELFGHPCHLFDAHPATGTAPQALAGAAVGAGSGQRDGACCGVPWMAASGLGRSALHGAAVMGRLSSFRRLWHLRRRQPRCRSGLYRSNARTMNGRSYVTVNSGLRVLAWAVCRLTFTTAPCPPISVYACLPLCGR